MYTTKHVNSISDCERFDREQYREGLWKKIDSIFK